ncbi:MAG TPA: hypothetical protein VE553_01425 [Candidatus Binatia bacterium]|nr:hypothetical protein [Candidatus Binatia bacterium]
MLRHRLPFHKRIAERCESYDWQEWSGCVTPKVYELVTGIPGKNAAREILRHWTG